ncbi:RHS repeat domain-containing protein [Stenotrophomonas sp. PD6]|uniref:RHS repeat domain-containing protein n=1 Tax=Stenotrophomonas sp. PD6 TaxID=3368612 RepID=UPI003BA0282F
MADHMETNGLRKVMDSASGCLGLLKRLLHTGTAAGVACLAALGMAAALPVHAQTTQTVLYVHTDALGSVVAKTDVNGNVVERYEYEPYGAAIGAGVQDGPAYTGHISDSATGLSYMQQRYYDPQLGVFLSVDPINAGPTGRGFQRYGYAHGNPYRFTDPDGRQALDISRRSGGRWQCGSDPHCANGLEGGAEKRVKAGLDKAWRGVVAHRLIQQDIVNDLQGAEVTAERVLKVGDYKGRLDIAIRDSPNAKWQVFELKPLSHMARKGLNNRATSQLLGYVQALKDLGEDAEVGRWSSVFPGQQSRWVNHLPVNYGGVIFSGSYVYGPGDESEASGIIYYADGPEATSK